MVETKRCVPVLGAKAPRTTDEHFLLVAPERRDELEGYVLSWARRGAAGGTWSDVDLVRKVIMLWEAKVPTAEMGIKCGVGKNAVLGAIHRMGAAGVPISDRASPINRDPVVRDRSRRNRQGVCNKSLDEAARIARQVLGIQGALPAVPTNCSSAIGRRGIDPGPVAGNMATQIASNVATDPAPKPRLMRRRQCCFPIGDPGTTGFRYCDAEFKSNDSRRNYCDDHHGIASTKVARKVQDPDPRYIR